MTQGTMRDTGTASEFVVSPEWLEAHRHDPNLRLIEVAGLRQEEMQSYKAGHVPGAMCWLWKDMLWDSHKRDFPDAAAFAERMAASGIGNDTLVVIYGEDIQFGIYGWWTLRYCGHSNVKILDGGAHLWKAGGRALETAIPPAPPHATYKPVARREEMRIFRDEVLSRLGDGTTAILDARSPQEYSGERVGGPGGPDVGAVRYGRIPGAIHVPHLDFFGAHHAFLPRAEIEAVLAGKGVATNRDIVTYCRMSHRATVAYFALHELLGLKNVRVYDGSWTEWGNLVGVPIER
jgi:thiosulfate/3-mercaptopyruvate sulfurtransferase